MRIIRSYQGLEDDTRGAAVAMGNFDGVHLGHQSIIALAKAAAAERNLPLGIITFEPHPRSFFAPDAPSFRLMNANAKARRLEKLGIELCFELPFDAALSSLSAEAFIDDVLVGGLGVQHVVVGADFRFGKKRAGDTDLLTSRGAEKGLIATVAPLVSDEVGDYSSTSIREALSAGLPEDAARILGHSHRIEGTVIRGDQRGRDLGYPTANLSMADLHMPRYGVYAVSIDILTGPKAGRYGGAASIGVRPTFGVNAPNLEVYIFDFDADIYGQEISVSLIAFLRDEAKFDDVDVMVAQMAEDCDKARVILSAE